MNSYAITSVYSILTSTTPFPAVWAVGVNGTILHYNGTSWSSVSSGTVQNLNSVWGTSASDVWAVGDGGTLLHYNGISWSSVTSGTTAPLHAVWGHSAADGWDGGGTTIFHYDGAY